MIFVVSAYELVRMALFLRVDELFRPVILDEWFVSMVLHMKE